MQSFRAAAVQLRAGPDKPINLAAGAEQVRHAAGEGARLVALPELFAWSGPASEEAAQAETVPGPASESLGRLARELGIWLVAGSLLERDEPSGAARCFNTCLLFGPDGALAARYRKIHLFDVAIDGAVAARESSTRQPGSEIVHAGTELGSIGLAVCYDLRFPELFRRLAVDGVEIVVMPSAFTAPTGAAHWHTLVRARAIENQCFVVAPNQFGATSHGFDSYGHSIIVDPWGEILAEAGADGPCIVAADLDGERLEQVRRKLPSLEHRRLEP